jgi:hypothetical protein
MSAGAELQEGPATAPFHGEGPATALFHSVRWRRSIATICKRPAGRVVLRCPTPRPGCLGNRLECAVPLRGCSAEPAAMTDASDAGSERITTRRPACIGTAGKPTYDVTVPRGRIRAGRSLLRLCRRADTMVQWLSVSCPVMAAIHRNPFKSIHHDDVASRCVW